ncbi:MAG: hypothetical protein V9F82_07505 [Dermatophilaceae bacterium]
MNAMMGLQLVEFKAEVDKLIAKGMEQDEAILTVLKNLHPQVESHPVLKATTTPTSGKKKRPNAASTTSPPRRKPSMCWANKLAQDFYGKSGVMSKVELDAYHNVQLHGYVHQTRHRSQSAGRNGEFAWCCLPCIALPNRTGRPTSPPCAPSIWYNSIGYQIDTAETRRRATWSAIKDGLEKLHKALRKSAPRGQYPRRSRYFLPQSETANG